MSLRRTRFLPSSSAVPVLGRWTVGLLLAGALGSTVPLRSARADEGQQAGSRAPPTRRVSRFGSGQVQISGRVRLEVGGELSVLVDLPAGLLTVRATEAEAATPAPEPAEGGTSGSAPPSASALELRLPTSALGAQLKYQWLKLRGGSRLLLLTLGEEAPYRVLILSRAGRPPVLVLKGRTGTINDESIELAVQGAADDHTIVLSRAPVRANLCGRTLPVSVQRLDESLGRFRPVAVPALSEKERQGASPLSALAVEEGTAGDLVELSLSPELGGSVRRLGARTVDTRKLRPAIPHAATEIPIGEFGRPRLLRAYRGQPPEPKTEEGAQEVSGRDPSEAGAASGERPELGGDPGGPELFLVTSGQVFTIELPSPLPEVVTIPVPDDVTGDCLALIQGTTPWVSEVTMLVAGDTLAGKSAPELASALGGRQGDQAARALAALGPEAIEDLLSAVRRLSASGRRRGEKVSRAWGGLESLRYDAQLVAAGSDSDVFRALPRLAAAGERGVLALASALPGARPAEERRLAEAIAELAPERAPELLVGRLNQSSPARRLEIRRVLSSLGSSQAARQEAEAIFGGKQETRRARSELLRAFAPFVEEMTEAGRKAALSLLSTARFHEAYRLSPVLVELSDLEPSAVELARKWLLGAEPELDLKQRAALQVHLLTLAEDQGARAEIFSQAAVALLESQEMRVRRASAGFLQARPEVEALSALGLRVRRDDWPEVRAQALLALAELRVKDLGAEEAEQIILRALAKDRDPEVRGAAAHGLDSRPTEQSRKSLRRAFARDESTAVRAEVARSLGLLCDRESLEPLTRAAQALGAGASDEADVRLGLEAASAVARLDPSDLDARLRPLLHEDVPGVLRARVQQAISRSRGQCATEPSE